MVICGVCRKEVPGRPDGHFFHSCDDWGHYRLFVCSTCLEHIPLQLSQHELCYECTEPPTDIGGYESARDLSPRFADLCLAVKQFELCHRALFEKLPFSNGPDAMHLGSLHPDSKKWLEKRGGA